MSSLLQEAFLSAEELTKAAYERAKDELAESHKEEIKERMDSFLFTGAMEEQEEELPGMGGMEDEFDFEDDLEDEDELDFGGMGGGDTSYLDDQIPHAFNDGEMPNSPGDDEEIEIDFNELVSMGGGDAMDPVDTMNVGGEEPPIPHEQGAEDIAGADDSEDFLEGLDLSEEDLMEIVSDLSEEESWSKGGTPWTGHGDWGGGDTEWGNKYENDVNEKLDMDVDGAPSGWSPRPQGEYDHDLDKLIAKIENGDEEDTEEDAVNTAPHELSREEVNETNLNEALSDGDISLLGNCMHSTEKDFPHFDELSDEDRESALKLQSMGLINIKKGIINPVPKCVTTKQGEMVYKRNVNESEEGDEWDYNPPEEKENPYADENGEEPWFDLPDFDPDARQKSPGWKPKKSKKDMEGLDEGSMKVKEKVKMAARKAAAKAFHHMELNYVLRKEDQEEAFEDIANSFEQALKMELSSLGWTGVNEAEFKQGAPNFKHLHDKDSLEQAAMEALKLIGSRLVLNKMSNKEARYELLYRGIMSAMQQAVGQGQGQMQESKELKSLKEDRKEIVKKNKELVTLLGEASEVVDTIKQELQKTQLENKVLRDASLNERQREKFVEIISEADTAQDAQRLLSKLKGVMLSESRKSKKAKNALQEVLDTQPRQSLLNVRRRDDDSSKAENKELENIKTKWSKIAFGK